jgi:very-short-patch-repair endonuclease
MESKVEKWLDRELEDLKEYLKEKLLNSYWYDILTPIEQKFYLAWEIDRIGRYDELSLDYYEHNKYPLLIPQYEITVKNKKYIVDFAVVMNNLRDWDAEKTKNDLLLIELDSYLWHGSTPEQYTKEKERERVLFNEGYKVMRFSGREIYKDVEKCINEVIGYLQGEMI